MAWLLASANLSLPDNLPYCNPIERISWRETWTRFDEI